jgi:hypothetical protein
MKKLNFCKTDAFLGIVGATHGQVIANIGRWRRPRDARPSPGILPLTLSQFQGTPAAANGHLGAADDVDGAGRKRYGYVHA